jgi:hypothetical protein
MPYNDYKDNDYTKYRAFGTAPATSDTTLKIGRKNPTYVTVTQDVATISGTVSGTTILRTNYR